MQGPRSGAKKASGAPGPLHPLLDTGARDYRRDRVRSSCTLERQKIVLMVSWALDLP